MAMKPIASLLVALPLLLGCATPQQPRQEIPVTLYDAAVFSADSGKGVTISQLAHQLSEMDVIVVGEHHGHQASHLLQARLQAALYSRNPEQALALEPFDLDHQREVDQYLEGRLGEEELIEDAGAWRNYRASYRPLMEFARWHQLPVVAANAPDEVVRCVGRKGPGYLDGLPSSVRNRLPAQPFREAPGYRQKFLEVMGSNGHGSHTQANRQRLENSYQAQLLRDNTMADRVLVTLAQDPGHQVLVITGTFHSEERMGLVGVLEQRRPDLTIAVISPVILEQPGATPLPAEHAEKGDYLYFVQPLPEEYRDEQRGKAALMEQFSQARKLDCQ
ncbi:Uncharacterized iron-regulated protein [Marinobacter daqiaonensis]|uniref:Uncharacterized iron-regulated protein n=1 Tax=Marinobacter daqiaonensis TaxID=650891 RepID=A0A1I6JTS2_9GAMM|nr:ChaN family lipoprotein [Marinobacter daqiaonensis]SFR82356.1 Uncharacterized iron-regulated protein [Marinobacter daqiaonensis]